MAIKGFKDSFFRCLRIRKGDAPTTLEEHVQLYADQSTGALHAVLPDGTDVDLSTVVSGPIVLQGGYNATTNMPNLTTPAVGAVRGGYSWVVETAGSAFFAHALDIGDMLVARSDDPSALSDWIVLERDLSGAVTAAAPLAAGNFVSGVDGTQKAEDSGYSAASFDAAGAAAAVAGDLSTHEGLAGASVHGLGTASTANTGDFAAASHNHAATDVNSGTLDGDRLPAMSTTKKGGVPATGTPSGLFLKDDATWAAAGATPGGSNTQLQYNNSGAFGGMDGVTWNGTTLGIASGKTFSPLGAGADSVKIGVNATAPMAGAVAIGKDAATSSSYVQGLAIGYKASAQGMDSTAVGAYANAAGGGSQALGRYTKALGNYCTVVGFGYIGAAYNNSIILSTSGTTVLATASGQFTVGGSNKITTMRFGTGLHEVGISNPLKHGSNQLLETTKSTGATTTANGTLEVKASDGTTYYLLTAASA